VAAFEKRPARNRSRKELLMMKITTKLNSKNQTRTAADSEQKVENIFVAPAILPNRLLPAVVSFALF